MESEDIELRDGDVLHDIRLPPRLLRAYLTYLPPDEAHGVW